MRAGQRPNRSHCRRAIGAALLCVLAAPAFAQTPTATPPIVLRLEVIEVVPSDYSATVTLSRTLDEEPWGQTIYVTASSTGATSKEAQENAIGEAIAVCQAVRARLITYAVALGKP